LKSFCSSRTTTHLVPSAILYALSSRSTTVLFTTVCVVHFHLVRHSLAANGLLRMA
jgi:hypothetical protein